MEMPDLAAVARSFGLEAVVIDEVRDLHGALERALARPRPILIDVRVVRDEALSPKVASMPQPDGSMVTMPIEDMSPLLPLESLRAEMACPLVPESLRAKR